MVDTGTNLHSLESYGNNTDEKNLKLSNTQANAIDDLVDSSLDHSSGKDDLFMQLQTKFFDLLLEIHHLIPSWGSYKENFYFHWKRIIGASSVKDIHAYKLIFRCLGNLSPSSTPIFILKPVIKQLDEYRKISEADYIPTDLDIIIPQNQPLPPVSVFQSSQQISLPASPIGNTNSHFEKCYGNKNYSPKSESDNSINLNQNNTDFNKINDFIPNLLDRNNLMPPGSPHNPASFLLFSGDSHSQSQNAVTAAALLFGTRPSINTDSSLNSSSYCDKQISSGHTSITCLKGSELSPDITSNNLHTSTFTPSTCTSSSSLSPSDYGMAGPLMAAFQHIQAVAAAAAVVSQNKNSPDRVKVDNNSSQPPKKRPRRNGEIQGVYFDKIRKLWRANWKENGRVKTKGFSVFQYGDEGARQKAIDYRKKMEREFYIVPPHSRQHAIPVPNNTIAHSNSTLTDNMKSNQNQLNEVKCEESLCINAVSNTSNLNNVSEENRSLLGTDQCEMNGSSNITNITKQSVNI
ncbi:AP2 domain-containing protein [Cryptosporidium muris RN66]|uniref:AP2 domain-containing protein n=1 Tax=Cryptosporidium muris (strain RN66) TaxID=441375 RepID=B6AC07_CRYMR|nr:AP2 domain-containing protein [Cryptosporidium muris RN66]EEA05360.1 AP2 domain-containing protein [Cryptosporidium muris RN66]|eukprot:XP_002139709.1 AP2 domain-containing protein [Cryptosporidium muris RN66]